jgi:hypothetical protein
MSKKIAFFDTSFIFYKRSLLHSWLQVEVEHAVVPAKKKKNGRNPELQAGRHAGTQARRQIAFLY